jgi:hypothetical protein
VARHPGRRAALDTALRALDLQRVSLTSGGHRMMPAGVGSVWLAFSDPKTARRPVPLSVKAASSVPVSGRRALHGFCRQAWFEGRG